MQITSFFSKPHLRTTLTTFLLAASTTVHAQTKTTYAEIAPILAQRCAMCHAGATPAAGLRLDSHDALLKGGAKGPVVKARAPAESELIRRIKGISLPRMPMTGPPFLSDAEIALFERWVAEGAQGSQGAAAGAAPPPAAKPMERPKPGEMVTYAHVAPIFAQRCAKCHTDNGQMGPPPEGYRLTSYEATLSRADRVRVVPGQPGASELSRRIRGIARPRMPMDGPPYLDAEDIRLIDEWITQGARDASGKLAPPPVGAQVRLHGSLDANGRLDGLPLIMGGRTRIDRDARGGGYTQVRGHLDSSGRVVVERLSDR
jgi:mono/diheme cytochrome c family protein